MNSLFIHDLKSLLLLIQENAISHNHFNKKEIGWVPKNKLRTYSKFKTNFGIENYLKTKMNIKHRKALAKMRISAHDLHIERGRYLSIPPEARKCPFCPSEVETEEHVLFHCHQYDSVRKTFKEKMNLNSEYTLQNIMTLENVNQIRLVAKFCFDIFENRENNISILSLKNPIYFLSVVFYFYFS